MATRVGRMAMGMLAALALAAFAVGQPAAAVEEDDALLKPDLWGVEVCVTSCPDGAEESEYCCLVVPN